MKSDVGFYCKHLTAKKKKKQKKTTTNDLKYLVLLNEYVKFKTGLLVLGI